MAGLSLRAVDKSYGPVAAVRGLTFEAEDGELLVLVGPSGSGKTTALRLIAGLERPDAGSIVVGGRDITLEPGPPRDVAMVFQSYALFPHLSVRGNLTFGPRARREDAAATRTRIDAVAETLAIGPLLDRRPSELSGGERQRVALARAMLREPAVFLMDEPLSNLDAQLRTQMRAEIVRLQARLGTTTVYVTHDQVEALSMGHRVGVLDRGELQQLGTPDEVYREPANLFVARFIGSPPMNTFDARAGGGVATWAGGSVSVPADTPERCIVGVRPEHVHVAGSRWSEGAPRATTFDARVELVETVGDQTVLVLEASGVPLSARAEPSFRPAHGERVDVWFDHGRIHVFDGSSGRAVR